MIGDLNIALKKGTYHKAENHHSDVLWLTTAFPWWNVGPEVCHIL